MNNVRKLIKSLECARNMQYVQGTYGNNFHEEAMESIFMDNGLSRVQAPHFSRNIEEMGAFLMPGDYMPQPCGHYNNPDFIVRVGDVIFPIEMKSSKKYTPKFGASPPKENMIYIFTSAIKGTSIVMGQTILPKAEYERSRIIDEEIRIKHRELIQTYGLEHLCSSLRLSWETKFNWFTDVNFYFDEVIKFVYASCNLEHIN